MEHDLRTVAPNENVTESRPSPAFARESFSARKLAIRMAFAFAAAWMLSLPLFNSRSAAMVGGLSDVARAGDALLPKRSVNWRRTSVLRDDQLTACQALGPAAPYCIQGIDGATTQGCGEMDWRAMGPITYQMFAQGEYVGAARAPHVPVYRLRADDVLTFIFRFTRDILPSDYRLEVGDQFDVKDFGLPELDLRYTVQPDGYVNFLGIGKTPAAGRSFEELANDLNERYKKDYRNPRITIIPVLIETKLASFRQTVSNFAGQGGQSLTVRVTPEGTIALPLVGQVFVNGLSLEEVQQELKARYDAELGGIEVIATLNQRAPRFVYVLGEVGAPGQVTMNGPTTLMQAIAQAGSWKIGANLRQVVVFRRGEDWRLLATMVDIRGALYGNRPTPADEIWLNDSDVVVVPKSPILVLDDFVQLVFTRGLYSILPTQFASFGSL